MDKLDLKKISEQVRQLGVFSKNNIFENKDFQFISNQLCNLTKKEKKIYFPTSFSDYLIKFLKIDFKKISLSKKLIKIANNLDFSRIASEILEDDVSLEVLDCYLSQKSKNTILEWHNDIGYNSQSVTTEKDFLKKAQSTINKKKTPKSSMGVKFFIYLTDVKSDDGALGIIPYSHKIVYVLTKLILEKKINLQSFWKLKDLRNILLNQDHKKYVLDSVCIIDNSGQHYCCVIHINNKEYGFDGASTKKITPFKWKHLLNKNKSWTFRGTNKDTAVKIEWNFTKGNSLLFYYLV